MTLNEFIEYGDKKLAEGEMSDGCTFSPDFGISIWCKRHDMVRRFKPISASEADKHFFDGIKSEGLKYYPIAYIYYIFVVIARKINLFN